MPSPLHCHSIVFGSLESTRRQKRLCDRDELKVGNFGLDWEGFQYSILMHRIEIGSGISKKRGSHLFPSLCVQNLISSVTLGPLVRGTWSNSKVVEGSGKPAKGPD